MKGIGLPSLAGALIAVVALSACGGGGSNHDQESAGPSKSSRCAGSFLGASRVSTSTANCPLCSVRDPENSIDGDSGTFAGITVPGGGTASLMATAQSGVVFPAGNQAGALLAVPASASAVSSYTFRTYLRSALQEEGGGTSDVGGSNAPENPNYHTFTTSKPFDSVEVSITRTGSADAGAFKIYEVCAE